MMAGKATIIVLVALVVGFGAGYALRPVISRPREAAATISQSTAVSSPAGVRGVPYFAANMEDARRVVGGCRDGWMRGDECANAEQAVTEAEGRGRFKKFMGN